MIILYDTNERAFTTLGLGVLRDAIRCDVGEEVNGSYELEMEYPITGAHYSDIQVGRLILTKSNPYDTKGEPFRIYKITKPINGVVTISAQHISYDLSGYTVELFKGTDLDDTFSKIQNGTIITSPFTFTRGADKENVQTEFEIKQPYSQRGILAGSDGSVLDVYRGEFIFSRFNVTLCNHRGADRGICIRYGKNMTDIEQEINFEKGYTGVYPYYANTVTETKTEEHMVYEQVYIVEDKPAFSKDWFSLSEGPNNSPLLPILHDSPVQCATEGDYYQHIFIWHTIIDEQTGESHDEYVDVTSTAAEDYPPNRKSVETYNEDTYEFVTLPEKIIYINEEAEHQNILTLDLTSDLSDVPTEEQLRNRANKYITDNKLGEPTSTIKVSFVKLSDSPEYEQFKLLETVKLGDTVKVEYVALGISTSLQVISYTYNAITNLYSEIELGTKSSTLSETVMTTGDNISSLTNDVGYTDKTTVNELIAKMITADYIEAMSATFSDAQIKNLLTTDSIRTRIIEASQFDIDYLVAEKLVANDAEIYDTLTAGNIKVRGDIDVLAGSITISGTPTPTDGYLNADTTVETYSEDWLCSDATGLTPIVPDEGEFYICKTTGTEYYNKVYRYLNNRYEEWISDTTFEVDPYGNVYANSVELTGYITATAGNIGGCEIIDGQLHVPVAYIDGTIYADAIKLDYNSTYSGYNVSIDGNGIDVGIIGANLYNFSVDDDGVVSIKRGEINLGYNGTGYNFSVDDTGEVSINAGSISISGTIPTIDAYINADATVAEFSRNWLCSDSAGTTPIIPNSSKYYLIKTTGDYYNLIYIWNSSESKYKRSYITPSGVQFMVNKYGQLETNSIVALAGNIGGCEIIDGTMKVPTIQLDGVITANAINLGNGQFTVDTMGTVTIRDGDLLLGYNRTYQYYNVEIDDTGIRLGYDRNNDYYNFEVNDDGEITIRKGSINIKRNMTSTLVIINPNATATYASNWLMDITGTTVITPDSTKYYYITSSGTYFNKRFKWDTLNNMYYEVYSSSETFFEVDEDGNVQANSLVVTSGIIGGCEIANGELRVKTANIDGVINANAINLGNGQFVVNTSGNVSIKYGSINLGHIAPLTMYIWQNNTTGVFGANWLNPDSATSSTAFFAGDLPYKTAVRISSSDEYNGRYFIPNYDINRWVEITSNELYPSVVISDDEFSLYSGSINLGLTYSNVFEHDEETGDDYLYVKKDYNFTLNDDGELVMKKGSISLGYNSTTHDYNFSVDDIGNITANSGTIAGLLLSSAALYTNPDITGIDDKTHYGLYLSEDGIRLMGEDSDLNEFYASLTNSYGFEATIARFNPMRLDNTYYNYRGAVPCLSLDGTWIPYADTDDPHHSGGMVKYLRYGNSNSLYFYPLSDIYINAQSSVDINFFPTPLYPSPIIQPECLAGHIHPTHVFVTQIKKDDPYHETNIIENIAVEIIIASSLRDPDTIRLYSNSLNKCCVNILVIFEVSNDWKGYEPED